MPNSTLNQGNLSNDLSWNKLMILRDFPSSDVDLSRSGKFSDRQTTVCHSKARSTINLDYPIRSAPLSVRCVFAGRESYTVGSGTPVVLNQCSYLVLNDSQVHRRHLRSGSDLESLTIFFSLELAQSVLSQGLCEGDLLQFESSSKNRLPIQFFERIHELDDIVSPRLALLRSFLLTGSKIDEQLILDEVVVILQRMLHVHRNDIFRAEALPFAKGKTRLEMFEKLHRAKDYISSNLEQDLTLMQMASIAELSQSHFQRCFSQLFDITPHQFLIKCRLKRACDLLRTNQMTVTQVCLEVGFDSLGSFSALFSDRFGVSPNRFRIEANRLSRK